MSHPLLSRDNKGLRADVLVHLKNAYVFPNKSNIIFVCGGNDDEHMRPRFLSAYSNTQSEFLLFKPEYAIDHVYSLSDQKFNLSLFEVLIGEISHAIVIFPEAAGSFAEAGYFSALKSIAKKSILILDEDRDKENSFLSLGPSKLIAEESKFDAINLRYSEPDFAKVFNNFKRQRGRVLKKEFPQKKYRDLSYFEKLSISFLIYDLLNIATPEDVKYIFSGLFAGQAQEQEIVELTAILVGAGLLKQIDDTNKFGSAELELIGCSAKRGFKKERNAIKTEILNLIGDENNLLGDTEDAA